MLNNIKILIPALCIITVWSSQGLSNEESPSSNTIPQNLSQDTSPQHSSADDLGYWDEVKYGFRKVTRGIILTGGSLSVLCAKYPEIVSGITHFFHGESKTLTVNDDQASRLQFPDTIFSETFGRCRLNPPHVVPHEKSPGLMSVTDLIGFRSCDHSAVEGKFFVIADYTKYDGVLALGHLEIKFVVNDIRSSIPSLTMAAVTMYGTLEVLTGASIILTASINHPVNKAWSWLKKTCWE